VPWRAPAFEDFLRLETAVPLLVDHGALIDSRGVIADMGAGAPFAAVMSPLPGLLCLGDVGRAGGHGDQLLYDIELMLQQTWPPAGGGISIGVLLTTEDADLAWPHEVSLTEAQPVPTRCAGAGYRPGRADHLEVAHRRRLGHALRDKALPEPVSILLVLATFC
jgi:hypothetical protein